MGLLGRCVLVAGLALAGCGDGGGGDAPGRDVSRQPDPPARVVTGEIGLDRPPPGPPDAGTVGGHGAPDGVAQVRGPALDFEVRLTPGDARLTAVAGRGAHASVSVGRAVRVRVRGLRRGRTTVELRATAPGRSPWLADVAITRR